MSRVRSGRTVEPKGALWMAEVGEEGGAFKKLFGGVGNGPRIGARLMRAVESCKGKSKRDTERCGRLVDSQRGSHGEETRDVTLGAQIGSRSLLSSAVQRVKSSSNLSSVAGQDAEVVCDRARLGERRKDGKSSWKDEGLTRRGQVVYGGRATVSGE